MYHINRAFVGLGIVQICLTVALLILIIYCHLDVFPTYGATFVVPFGAAMNYVTVLLYMLGGISSVFCLVSSLWKVMLNLVVNVGASVVGGQYTFSVLLHYIPHLQICPPHCSPMMTVGIVVPFVSGVVLFIMALIIAIISLLAAVHIIHAMMKKNHNEKKNKQDIQEIIEGGAAPKEYSPTHDRSHIEVLEGPAPLRVIEEPPGTIDGGQDQTIQVAMIEDPRDIVMIEESPNMVVIIENTADDVQQ